MLTCYTTYTPCCVGKLNRPTDNENSTRICLVLLKDTAHYAISELRKDILLSQNVTLKKTFVHNYHRNMKLKTDDGNIICRDAIV